MVASPTVATTDPFSSERVTTAGLPPTVAPTSPDLTLVMSGDVATTVVEVTAFGVDVVVVVPFPFVGATVVVVDLINDPDPDEP